MTSQKSQNTCKLSIIIPAYNAAEHIRRCLNSIFALPLSTNELEVIVVDDCSTDETMSVLQEIQQEHQNLVILHQDRNQRQGAARNRGIDVAKGEYLVFCDSDDYMLQDGVMNALQAVQKSHADICYYEYEYEYLKGQWIKGEMPNETHNALMSSSIYLENYYTCGYNAPWRNLYKTNFLHHIGIRFMEGVRWEDCDWTVKVYAQAKEIQFVDGVGYRYCSNETNTCSQSHTPKAIAEQLYAGLRLLQFADEVQNQLPGLATTLRTEARNRYVGLLKLRNLTRLQIPIVAEMYDELDPNALRQLKEYKFSPWVNYALRHKQGTLFCLSICTPIAQLIRTQMHKNKRQ